MSTSHNTPGRAKPPALVVGTGFGCRVHVPALRAAGFDVAGVIGTDADRTRQRAEESGVPLAFTNLEEAIARTRAVVVSIATPPHTHAPLSMIAIAHGCHVLCEKPLARDVSEAQAMLAAAERAGVAHLVGHEFRWRPERALIARSIANGVIGEPRLLTLVQHFSIVASPDARMPPWWFDSGAGGGWLGASGSHSIDQVRAWLGEFTQVSAALPTVSARKDGAEDSFTVRFRLVNGVEGMMQQTAGAWGPPADTTRIAGTEGTLWIDGNAVWLADRKGARELPVPADLALASPEPQKGGVPQPASNVQLFTQLCGALRGAMEGKPTAGPVRIPTFADGVACMRVLDAIRASAARGGALVTVEQSQ